MSTHDPVAEKQQSLWLLAVAPSIWAVHFMLSYVTAAIWCEKMVGPDNLLGPVRTAIWVYTFLAIPGILLTGWKGYKKHKHGEGQLPHDQDTPEDRHRFLGFATVLLAGLSVIATLFSALVLAFFWRCD